MTGVQTCALPIWLDDTLAERSKECLRKRLKQDVRALVERREMCIRDRWEIAALRRQNGEAQIPIELPWRCIKMHADVHGLVIDPFAGLRCV